MTREDAAAFAAIQAASYERAAPALLGSWPRERALGADGLAAFLDSQRFCVLATVTASGRPQARPVRFAVADCAFWIATVGGARLRNVRAGRGRRLAVERFDGEPVVETDALPLLVEAGFLAGPRRAVLRA